MEPFEVLILIVVAAVGIPLAICALILFWPLMVGCYFGHPLIGLALNVLWLMSR